MAEKVARIGVERDPDWMYYVKDGDVWKVQRRSPGVPKGRPVKAATARLKMDTDYIYFVDKDGDIARARRAVGPAHDDDEDEDEAPPKSEPGETKELLYALFPNLEVPEDTQNVKLIQDEAARIFAEVNGLDQLRSLTPRQFEELLAEMFYKEGYEAHLTPPSKDGGRDVIAVLPGPLPYLVVAEAKHMRLVKPSVVYAMYGVQSRDRAHMGLVATTGRFSEKTRDMTQKTWGRQVGLRDGQEFVDWIRKLKTGRAG